MSIKRLVCKIILLAFGLNAVIPPSAFSQDIARMPAGILSLTPAFQPIMIQGMRIHPENPLKFDFIVDTGDASVDVNGAQFKKETTKLIKYFLASVTVPEKEMWVNLSPYEKDRIIAKGLGDTELGGDMLSQDYILKQLTSSLMYPDSRTGRDFWNKIYAITRKTFGTTEIPVDTFNKVWIVPEKAVVYERGNTVYIVESHLKVMLEADYTAMAHGVKPGEVQGTQGLSQKIIREVVLPEIEKEVNKGKNFANLRQIYNAMILAVWFKSNLKKSLMGQVYANRNKITGLGATDETLRDRIYAQYLLSFKKGVYNYIREENDPLTGAVFPRKYFSGGLVGEHADDLRVLAGPQVPRAVLRVKGKRVEVDSAMSVESPVTPIEADQRFEEIRQSIAQKLGVNSGSPTHLVDLVNRLAHVELVNERFLRSQEGTRGVLQQVFATIHSHGPPKIAEIHYSYPPPEWGGVNIVLAEEVDWLSKQGFPVTVISATPDLPDTNNQRFVYIPELKPLAAGTRLMEDVHRNDATAEFKELENTIYTKINQQIADQDIIIIQNVMTIRNNLPFTAALDRIIRENPHKQFILYIHNTEDVRHTHYPLSLLNPELPLPNVRYVTVSEDYRAELSRKFNMPKDHFSILNPGVHPYSPLKMTSQAVDDFKQHGLLGDDKVITLAFPTRVDRNKDIGKIFLILKGLVEKERSVKLVIAAPGIDSFDKLIEDVRMKIGDGQANFLQGERAIVEKNIVFLDTSRITDYQEHRQYIRDIMALSDSLIYSTTMETFGMFVLEAATAGTDIMATKLGPHEESVGGRALLFEHHEPLDKTVGDILGRIASDKNSQSFRDETQRIILERYDWDNLMVSQMVPLLSAALGNIVFPRDQQGMISRIRFGDALRENGYLNAAKEVYESTLPVNEAAYPQNYISRIDFGESLENEGYLNAARAIYETVLRIDSNNTQARIKIANILLHQGDSQGAALMYRKVQEIDPPNTDAREGLKRLSESQAMISPVFSRSPDIEESISEGGIVNRLVRYDQDRVSAHIAVGEQPNPRPEIIMAMPNRSSENAFFLKASSNEGDFAWKMGRVAPVVTSDGHRGIDLEISADKHSVKFDFADKSNFMLSDVVDLRMFRYYGQNIPQQEGRLMAHILQMPKSKQEELERLIGVPLSEIIIPKVDVQRQEDGSHLIAVTKTTFDGKHHYRLYIQVPSGFTVKNTDGSIEINGASPVQLLVRATTDFEPLTPVPVDEIFNQGALEQMRIDPRFKARAQKFAILFYKEKLMAGSWPYLAYYGRDTLVTARLMWTALSLKSKEIIVRSVLDRIGGREIQPDFDGVVAVTDEFFPERFFQANVTQKFNESPEQNSDILAMFKEAIRNTKQGTLVYSVLDCTFLLPSVEKLLFNDLDDQQLGLYLDLENGRAENNIQTMLRNWNRILELTDPYTQGINALLHKNPGLGVEKLKDLVEFRGLANRLVRKLPGANDVNWRDSPYGIGWGDYAADINVSLAPIAIAEIASMIKRLEGLGINVQALAKKEGFQRLQEYLDDNAKGLARSQAAWSTTVEHFKTHLDKEQVRAKLGDFFRRSFLPPERMQFLRKVVISKAGEDVVTVQDFLDGKTPAWLEGGISFTNIAMDRRIIHSDETYSLLDKDLDSVELNRILDEIFAPYPIGLWNDDVGLFIANAIFSDDVGIQREFEREGAYHGQNVVWSKPVRELTLGLIRQIRYAKKRGNGQDVKRLEDELVRVIRVGQKVGDLWLSEVWTWQPGENGHMKAMAYHQQGGQPPGNPQLWANSDISRQPEYAEAIARLTSANQSPASSAMLIKHNEASVTPGGINLDAGMLSLQVKRDGKGMAFPASVQDAAMQVNGLTPVIIRIKSMDSPLLS